MNGDFRINQRGFSSSTANGTYGFDRWLQSNSGGTTTYSAQAFTVGSPAAAGYEAQSFARLASSGQSGASDFSALVQYVEDVRTLAGTTVTVSFWAKAASGTPKVAVELGQRFGSGGSPSADVSVPAGQVTLSTSWTRYSVTVAIPSIAGKTIGTTPNTSSLVVILWTSAGSTLNARTGSLGIQNNTFDFWGVQMERGAAATTFEERPLAVELVACERYFQRYGGGGLYEPLAQGFAYSGTDGLVMLPLRTAMRVLPQLSIGSGVGQVLYPVPPSLGGAAIFTTSLSATGSSPVMAQLNFTSSGMNTGPVLLRANNNLNATWDFSAEF